MELGSGTFDWKIHEWVGLRKGSGEVYLGNPPYSRNERKAGETELLGRQLAQKENDLQKKIRSKLWLSVFARVWRQEFIGYMDFR